MQDRSDPHARQRAFDIASKHPLGGLSAQASVEAVAEILSSIGDACHDCPDE